ncbi:MAG: hypothetical protein QXF26_04110 [Candidatus Bathyarchaeia archaeon]
MSAIVPEEILIPIRALIMITALSLVYKRNIGFVALENAMVGAICGITVAEQTRALTQGITPRIAKGDLGVIIPIIYGLCFLSMYSRRTKYLNRLVIIIQLALTLGLSMPQQYYNIYLMSLGYTKWTDINRIITSILFMCAVTFFIFGKKTSRVLRVPMVIGSYAIYTFCALMVAAVVYLGADNIIGITYDMVRNPLAAATLLIIPIYIIVDRMRQGIPIFAISAKKST